MHSDVAGLKVPDRGRGKFGTPLHARQYRLSRGAQRDARVSSTAGIYAKFRIGTGPQPIPYLNSRHSHRALHGLRVQAYRSAPSECYRHSAKLARTPDPRQTSSKTFGPPDRLQAF